MYKKLSLLFLCLCLCFSYGCGQKTPDNAKLVSAASKEEVMQKDYSMLSNKMLAWGMKKNKGAAPDVDAESEVLLKNYNGIYKTEEKKTLYLTFDLGYEAGYTAQILDTLQKKKVSAAFFITGDYLKTQPELVKRMVEEGHNVGNHTMGHPSMPLVTDNKKLVEDIASLDQAFFELTGTRMNLFRPPKGEFSERTLAITRDLGYKTVFWSFAYVDWERDKARGAEYAYNQIMPYMHDGAIILLHAVSKDNAEVLEKVISDLQAQGYTFATL